MATTETGTTDPQCCIAFSAQLAVSEAAQRSRPVLIVKEDGTLRAKLRIGAASVTVEIRTSGQRKAVVKQVNVIPTTLFDTSRLDQGILGITGTWPTSSLCLKLSSAVEARRVHQELEAVASAVVWSLHLQSLPGAPLLTACPQLERQPSERGDFHLGGYALWDDFAVNQEPRGTPRRFRLYWVELCGPIFGMSALYFYSSHAVDGKLMNYTVLNRGGFSLVANQVKIHGQEPKGGVMYAFEAEHLCIDETLTFRSFEEARLWFDMATAMLHSGGDCQEESVARIEEVISELHRQARSTPGAPLLADASYSLAPKPQGPLPTDSVATYTRKRQEDRMQALVDAFALDDEEDEGLEAAYDSFGTTVFH